MDFVTTTQRDGYISIVLSDDNNKAHSCAITRDAFEKASSASKKERKKFLGRVSDLMARADLVVIHKVPIPYPES